MTYNEDEQLEQIKRFWDDYGTGILMVIALCLACFAGFRFWQKSRMDNANIAIGVYQDTSTAMQKLQTNPKDAAANTELQSKAQKLMQDFAGTPFANNAALELARHAVDNGDLKEATKQLNWVLSQKPDDGIRTIATVRLARIKAAGGDSAGALSLLAPLNDEAFSPIVNEARADIYQAQGKIDDARKAYQAADAALLKRDEPASPLLAVKMSAVGLIPAKRDEDNKATGT